MKGTCSRDNFQTIKAINVELRTLIEFIMEKSNAQEPSLCHSKFVSHCPLLIFSLKYCLNHDFQTINAIKLELHTLIEHVMDSAVHMNNNSAILFSSPPPRREMWRGAYRVTCVRLCVYVLVRACVRPILVRSITSTFENRFQKVAHFFSLTSTSVMRKICLHTPEVQVTV